MNIILTLLKVVEYHQKASQCDKDQNIQKTIGEIVKSDKKHPNILQIKDFYSSSFYVKEKFCSHFVNEIKIKKLTQGLNSKKATRIDTIP